MEISENGLSKALGLSLIFSAALLLTACGGSSSRSATNPDSGNDSEQTDDSGDAGEDSGDGLGDDVGTDTGEESGGDTGEEACEPTAEETCEDTGEETCEPTAEETCEDTGEDTGDTGGSGDGKVSGPLDPVQDDVVTGVLVNEVGSQLPTELSGTVACTAAALNHLIDAPDAVLVQAAGLPDGSDPVDAFNAAQADMQAALERFAGQLQSALSQLAGSGTCDPAATPAASSGNPMAGTPLETVGAEIATLVAALENSANDPSLTSVTATLAPALTALGDAMDAVPSELQDAPVLGAATTAIADALDDLAAMLVQVGNYNGDNTAAAAATLIDNLLTNVLLGVVPVAEVDAATGQNFSGEIAAGIASLSAQLGSAIGEVITPLFGSGLVGALQPLTDPVDGAVALILHPSALNTDTGVWEAGSPALDAMQGVLVANVGDVNASGSPADALVALLIAAQAGNSVDDLVNGFVLSGGGSQLADVTALVTDANALLLDAGLLSVLTLVEGLVPLSTSEALAQVIGDNLL